MAIAFPHLCELVEDGVRGLPGVARRRMFGCDAYFVDGAIFALIWKDGRVGVKLPDADAYAALMACEGAEPWCVGDGKQMGSWLLVPEEFHDDVEALTPWLRKAYAQVRGRKPAAKKAAKVSAAKKAARA